MGLSSPILLEHAGVDGVATLTLNRPEQLNAFTAEMCDRWADGLIDLAQAEATRVIVVTGAGRAFCSGGDLGELAARDTALERKSFLRDHVHRVARALLRIDQPVIAMINGAAIGAGLDMALLCDMRFAAEDAKLGEAYVKVGLVPGDGGAWLLPRLVGESRALELLWTGRILSGGEAEQWGMVNRALPADKLVAQTYDFARKLAAGPQTATRLIKQAVRGAAGETLEQHLERISSLMAIAQDDPDHAAAINRLRKR